MSIRRKLSSFDDDIDFSRLWRVGLMASVLLIVVSIAAIGVRGLNLGIDFEGGTRWDVPAGDLEVEEVRDVLRPFGEASARIQYYGTGGDRILRVRSAEVDEDSVVEIGAALAGAAGVVIEEVSAATVGPAWGDRITRQARNALVVFFIVISAYIAVRLEWKMAIGALASMVHDILISVGFYALFQFEITPATVIAFLTILGYSLYDTIVVFDRVQANTEHLTQSSRQTYTGAVSLSLNQVLMRSINTTITSLLPVMGILVVGAGILGVASLEEFAVALAVGLVLGAYSSIFIAAPILAWVKEREPRMRDLRERVAARGGPVTAGAVATAGGTNRPTGTGATEPAARPRPRAGAAPQLSGRPIPPRPRKKGRRR
jgi:preprotein translocase subunit SecF